MPTHEVLAPSQRAQFTELPDSLSERDLARYYTLSPEDLAVIAQRRRPHNRLGFAVQLAYLRFPGRPLRAGEQPPEAVVAYLAAQLDLDPVVLEEYARERDTTRREHLLEIQRTFEFRPFSTQTYRELAAWLLPTALSTDSGMALVTALVEEMRVRKIVAPALYQVERLAWETRRRAERQMFQRLTASLTPEQCAQLDTLLTVPPERSQTVLVWLRQPPGKPAPATILKLIDRLNAIRALGLDHTLAQQIHQNWLRKLAREGARYTPSFLARFDGPRRYATLVAFLLESAATLTDQILDLHDRLMTQYLRRSEQAHAEQFHQSGRQINEKVRLYASVGKALIAAREQEQDPYQAIAAVLPWERFVQSVAEAE
jgi:TnpA family transposase